MNDELENSLEKTYTAKDMANAINFGIHLEAGCYSDLTEEDYKTEYPYLNQFLRLDKKGEIKHEFL